MKDIRGKILNLLGTGYCTPQIARLAKKLKEPSTTIHYNIKRLEESGAIRAYKAVLGHKDIDQGHCAFVMMNLPAQYYGEPETVAQRIAKDDRVESVNICTGDYELLVKLRTRDIDEYYTFIKQLIKQFGVVKTVSMTSLKELKSEFIR
jgi:Lrp/AsnC family leucine-responsive transcriptional regulator